MLFLLCVCHRQGMWCRCRRCVCKRSISSLLWLSGCINGETGDNVGGLGGSAASVTTAPMKVAERPVPEQCCGQEFRRGGVEIESAGLERRYGFAGWRQGCPWARAQSACMCDSFESVVLHSLHPPVPKAVPPVLRQLCARLLPGKRARLRMCGSRFYESQNNDRCFMA